ncbi:hypothetical protein ACHAW5_008145, partial [Stephanodiscus triporus]
GEQEKISPFQHLLARGTAGFAESLVCHPLNTIKTRMQLTGVIRPSMLGSFPKDRVSLALGNTNFVVGWKRWRHRVLPLPTAAVTYSTAASLKIVASGTGGSVDGIFGTVRHIMQRQGPTALYQGLTVVYTGIIPKKMAIRFISFEHYKDVLGMWHNVVQTAVLIMKEEGLSALYMGVVPTMIRNGSNVAVNFTVFDWGKRWVLEWKCSNLEGDPGVISAADMRLDQWQTLLIGGLSGGVGLPPGCGQDPDAKAGGAYWERAQVQWTALELCHHCKGGGYEGALEWHHAVVDAFDARAGNYICNIQGSHEEDREVQSLRLTCHWCAGGGNVSPIE